MTEPKNRKKATKSENAALHEVMPLLFLQLSGLAPLYFNVSQLTNPSTSSLLHHLCWVQLETLITLIPLKCWRLMPDHKIFKLLQLKFQTYYNSFHGKFFTKEVKLALFIDPPKSCMNACLR